MRYRATICTSDPHGVALAGNLQAGQWIDYDGSLGRFMGFRDGIAWIAWGATARLRFARFASVFNSK